MNLIEKLNWRYATKRMNGTKVPQEKIDNILEAVRLAPTSLGLQAFKVIVIEDKDLKEKIFNEACQQPQMKESSHLLVFAAKKKVEEAQVDEYLKMVADKRQMKLESLSDYKAMFAGIVNDTEEMNFVWTARQAYIAFGFGLVAAAMESVDATPIEGFSAESLDNILGLATEGYSAVTIISLGYRDEVADYLSKAPKVRKSKEELFDFR